MDLFQNLLEHYKNLYGPGDTALASLDNDILLALNEGKYLNEYVSKTIQDNDHLYEYISTQPEPHVDNVYYLWCKLGKDKQLEVYNMLIIM